MNPYGWHRTELGALPVSDSEGRTYAARVTDLMAACPRCGEALHARVATDLSLLELRGPRFHDSEVEDVIEGVEGQHAASCRGSGL